MQVRVGLGVLGVGFGFGWGCLCIWLRFALNLVGGGFGPSCGWLGIWFGLTLDLVGVGFGSGLGWHGCVEVLGVGFGSGWSWLWIWLGFALVCFGLTSDLLGANFERTVVDFVPTWANISELRYRLGVAMAILQFQMGFGRWRRACCAAAPGTEPACQQLCAGFHFFQ